MDEERPLKQRFKAVMCLEDIGGEVAKRQLERCFDSSSPMLKFRTALLLATDDPDKAAVMKLVEVLKDSNQGY